jgi:hypothetical protein
MATTITRSTVIDNGDYLIHAQVAPVDSPTNGYCLTITSQLKSARNPNEEQVRFLACMTQDQLQNLANVIQNGISDQSVCG